MTDPQPTEARRLPDAASLRLTWSDGHVAEYPYPYLRGMCPCAACQGHEAQQVRYQPPSGAVGLDEVRPVGNYALSFRFSDGHGTGIYRFDFLRSICPCAACIEAREGKT